MFISKEKYNNLYLDKGKFEFETNYFKDRYSESRAEIFSLKSKIEKLQQTIVDLEEELQNNIVKMREMEEIPNFELFQYNIIYTQEYPSSTPFNKRVRSGYIAAEDAKEAMKDLMNKDYLNPNLNIIDIQLKECSKNFQQTSDTILKHNEIISKKDKF